MLQEVSSQLADTENQERAAAALKAQQSALVLVSSMEQGIAIANYYATEHLSIQTGAPKAVAEQITNAGALFVGAFSPVSLGDYLAGSNHVLPTGGQARFSSGLGVHTFLRAQQLIDYSQSALSEVANNVVAIANQEGLSAHGDAIKVRF